MQLRSKAKKSDLVIHCKLFQQLYEIQPGIASQWHKRNSYTPIWEK